MSKATFDYTPESFNAIEFTGCNGDVEDVEFVLCKLFHVLGFVRYVIVEKQVRAAHIAFQLRVYFFQEAKKFN